jgi:membrane protein DedA with SNARE-associated domain
LGIFVIAFVAGSSIPTPVSYLITAFSFSGIHSSYGIWHPVFVGLSGGFGAGIGGTLVYLFGRGGRRYLFTGIGNNPVDLTASKSLANRFVDMAQRRGSVVVFLMSAMLNPAFAPMAIAMGALRFRMVKFFFLCLAGNLLKAMVTAFLGYVGIGTLLEWLGI